MDSSQGRLGKQWHSGIDRRSGTGRGEGVRLKVCFQSLKIISPTASWIQWPMQVPRVCMWWVNLDLFLLRRTIYARQFASAKPLWRNHSAHYTYSGPTSRLSNSLMPNAKLRSVTFPVVTSFSMFSGVTPSGKDWDRVCTEVGQRYISPIRLIALIPVIGFAEGDGQLVILDIHPYHAYGYIALLVLTRFISRVWFMSYQIFILIQ